MTDCYEAGRQTGLIDWIEAAPAMNRSDILPYHLPSEYWSGYYDGYYGE